MAGMEAGLHLPQVDLSGDGLSYQRLVGAVDAARESGFVAVSANDHLFFDAPWMDGPSALAAVVEHVGPLALATTVSLPTLRGPVQLARTLLALDVLSEGALIAGVAAGSSQRDYAAAGVPFEQRWERFDEAVGLLRALLSGAPPGPGHHYAVPIVPLEAPREAGAPWRRIPLWVGSWGSPAGLRRVARLGDGWLASAYNTTPARFALAMEDLRRELQTRDRSPDGFPHALVTMWTWITEDPSEAERVLEESIAPLLHRDPAELRGRVCVGSAQMCAELLSEYALAGCERVHFWPLRAERRQVELLASEVLPHVHS